MKVKNLILSCAFLAGLASCSTYNGDIVRKSEMGRIVSQMDSTINVIESKGKFVNPVTLNKDGSVYYCNYGDWRSGFFPGSVWLMYELTGDSRYLPYAEKYTEGIREAQNITWNHDIGFIINCSFGNGLKLVDKQGYKDVMIKSAKSLMTRFRENAGIIQSWNTDGGWQSKRGWKCPVIIDNMMNLELLFKATELTGDSAYYNVAVSHADRTMKEHFRPDGSCYHVVDYDPETGEVRSRQTAQGYSHESAWSRGQAWAIYGYTVCYRYTRQQKYLDQAVKTFKMMENHKNMPSDGIPYWDMDAPDIPDTYRDASAAACIASALYEIASVTKDGSYRKYADKILKTLSSDEYLAEPGRNGGFLLMHSVGSLPHGAEIDVPLNYADYYYLEALIRKKIMR